MRTRLHQDLLSEYNLINNRLVPPQTQLIIILDDVYIIVETCLTPIVSLDIRSMDQCIWIGPVTGVVIDQSTLITERVQSGRKMERILKIIGRTIIT